MDTSITFSGPAVSALVIFGIVAIMTICGFIGHFIASFHVAPRNNLSHVFGAIFGLLACMTVAAFFYAILAGVIALLVTFIYTVFVVLLQRGC